MKLSVLHILPSLELGGAERVTIALAEKQREQGIDAQILTLRSKTDFLYGDAESAGIPLHVCGAELSRLARYRQILTLGKAFDVIHIHSPRGLSYISLLIPLLARKTIVYTRHGLDPLNTMKWRLVHAITLPFISHITFVTQFAYDVFAENYRRFLPKMRVVTNGVELPSAIRRVPSDVLRFGSVGRMVKLKGQEVLLDAIAALESRYGDNADQKFTLNFFGSGPVESELREQAQSINADLVRFHGGVADLEDIYEHIDVLVVTSSSEGLSMVIIEAMARNIPTIATEVGGNPTLVHPEKTGILIPYGDKDVLADAMVRLIENNALVREFGNAAKQLVEEKYSIMRTHQSYLGCYSHTHAAS